MRSQHAACLLGAVLVLVASTAFANNGTGLSSVANLDASAPSCSGSTSATVLVDTAVTSSGSSSSATVYLTVDNATPMQIDTIATTDWTGSGRFKTAERQYAVTVPANAGTTLTICYVQPGANGNTQKQTCSTVLASPSCQPPCPCYTASDVLQDIQNAASAGPVCSGFTNNVCDPNALVSALPGFAECAVKAPIGGTDPRFFKDGLFAFSSTLFECESDHSFSGFGHKITPEEAQSCADALNQAVAQAGLTCSGF